MASWIRTAATDESTPPERPQMTLAVADLLADGGDGLVAVGGHGPVAGEAGEGGEVPEDAGAVDGVVDLGVELHGVEVALRVRGDGEGGAGRGADHREARGEGGDAVAVAHPDLLAAGLEKAVKRGSCVSVGVTKARPNSAWWPASTRPPSWAIMVCWP